MTTLYRKYRPQNFKEVVGQNHIKLTLEHELASGKVAHAYLFCGPRAVGKTTMARVLAKAVNCTNRKKNEYEPCNKCDSCNDITLGKSVDIIEVDAASHTGVDNVRENIIASARISPVRSKNKVFVIDEVHMLSASAFNALLKILEEPPMNVIFILCTTEIHKVPNTIISRCQRFDFKKISVTDISKKLHYISETEGVSVDKDILDSVARQSDGHMRDAESLLGQMVSISGKSVSKEEAELVIPRSDLGETIALIDLLNKKDAAGAIRLVNRLVDEGVDLKTFVGDMVEILRKMILAKINPGLSEKLGLELGEAFELKINEVGGQVNMPSLSLFIDKFMKAKNELKSSSIVQLPLELAIVGICFSETSAARKPAGNSPAQNLPKQERKKGEVDEKMIEEVIEETQFIASIANNGIVSKDDISARWGEFLTRIKKENLSLSFILRVCEPRDLNGNELCLAFKYKFHKDRISEITVKNLVEKVLSEVYGTSLTMSAIVDEAMSVSVDADPAPKAAPIEEKKEAPADGNMIDNLLKTFGGKVVG